MELTKLPEELLVEIISHFSLILRFGRDHYFEASLKLERENQERLSTLGALCCTSQSLKRIVEPVLYSTFVVYATCSERRILCFLRTIIAKPHLQHAVKSIHVDSPYVSPSGHTISQIWPTGIQSSALTPADRDWQHFGTILMKKARRIWRMDQFQSWTNLLQGAPADACIAVIINLASNIEQLAYVTHAKAIHALHFLSFLYSFRPFDLPKLAQLRDLVIAIPRMQKRNLRWAGPLHLFPSLQCLQAIGDISFGKGYVPVRALPTVTSLYLLDSNDGMKCVSDLIRSCQSLKHFCWRSIKLGHGGDKIVEEHFILLHEALSLHKNSLETVSITLCDIRKVLFNGPSSLIPTPRLPPLRALTDFTALYELSLSSIMLLGVPYNIEGASIWAPPSWWATNRTGHRISDLLPPSLNQLTIIDPLGLNRSSLVLHDLADDCKQFPALREVRFHEHGRSIRWEIKPTALIERFKDSGVAFEVPWTESDEEGAE